MALPIHGKKFLRVETPITSDGINLKYDENGKVQYKTTFLPITAKKEIERNDARSPKHLQKKITVMSGDTDTPEPAATGKPGRKPKTDETE